MSSTSREGASYVGMGVMGGFLPILVYWGVFVLFVGDAFRKCAFGDCLLFRIFAIYLLRRAYRRIRFTTE